MILSEVPMITVVLACVDIAVALLTVGRIVQSNNRNITNNKPFFVFNIFTYLSKNLSLYRKQILPSLSILYEPLKRFSL